MPALGSGKSYGSIAQHDSGEICNVGSGAGRIAADCDARGRGRHASLLHPAGLLGTPSSPTRSSGVAVAGFPSWIHNFLHSRR